MINGYINSILRCWPPAWCPTAPPPHLQTTRFGARSADSRGGDRRIMCKWCWSPMIFHFADDKIPQIMNQYDLITQVLTWAQQWRHQPVSTSKSGNIKQQNMDTVISSPKCCRTPEAKPWLSPDSSLFRGPFWVVFIIISTGWWFKKIKKIWRDD